LTFIFINATGEYINSWVMLLRESFLIRFTKNAFSAGNPREGSYRRPFYPHEALMWYWKLTLRPALSGYLRTTINTGQSR
jgi:hypothetical protein